MPRGRSSGRHRPNVLLPTVSKTASKRSSTSPSVVRERSTTWSAPSPRTVSTCSAKQVAVTRTPSARSSWTAAEPIVPLAPWTSTSWPRAGARHAQARQRVVGSLGGGRRDVVGHPVRRPGHRAVGPHQRELGVGAEPPLDPGEDPVAHVEPPRRRPERHDLAGELGAEHRPPRPGEPREGADEEGVRGAVRGVGAVDRRRAHPHQQLALARDGVGHLLHLDDLGRTVPPGHRRPHGSGPASCRWKRLRHSRFHASVSTERRIDSISSNSFCPQISGGASCTTGSPRSSARQ